MFLPVMVAYKLFANFCWTERFPMTDLVDRIVVFRRGRIVANLRRDETDGNDIVSDITGVKGGADAVTA